MRLVVQGPAITYAHLTHIHHLCGVITQFMQIAEHAYYLPNLATALPEIQQFCFEQKIDCAFIPNTQILKNFGLVVMDMDSTFITIECIDEIADMCNLKPQVAAITESAMRGEIEFAESLRLRVKLLAGLDQSALQRVLDERLQLTPGAQQLVDTCKRNNIKTMLVSGGFDFFTRHLQAMTGLDYIRANSLEIIDGKLTGHVLGSIVDAQAKADSLNLMREELAFKPEQVIAIGDGANDLKMMAAAGASIAYHAKPVVQAQATYALNYSSLDGVINLFSLN